MADDFWSGYNYSIPGLESTLNLTSRREHQQRCCTKEHLAHLAYFRGRTTRVSKMTPERPQVEAKCSIRRSMTIFMGGVPKSNRR